MDKKGADSYSTVEMKPFSKIVPAEEFELEHPARIPHVKQMREKIQENEEQAQRKEKLFNLLQVYKTRLNLKGRKPKFLKR